MTLVFTLLDVAFRLAVLAAMAGGLLFAALCIIGDLRRPVRPGLRLVEQPGEVIDARARFAARRGPDAAA